MFRKLRKQIIKEEEVIEILETATNGVLAVHGDDDYPYAVPVSFVYLDGKIYFHSTVAESHKMDAIKRNPKVSFCVITQDHVIEEKFTTIYKSAIAFGKARVLTDEKDIYQGIMAITKKYSGDYMEKGKEHIKKYAGKFCVVEIDIEHVTGKSGT